MRRVESRTGAVTLVYGWLVDLAFAAPPQSGLAWSCFLFPLIEPDWQFSRIRLSEKTHAFAHGRFAVRCGNWTKTEVVGPTDQHPIEPVHDGLRILPDFVASGFVADRSTDALHSFLRGYRAEVDAAPPHRVTPPERVSQKVKLLFRQITDPRL